MLRRSLSAALVLFVLGGFVLAGEHFGQITKYEDGKVTVKIFKKKGEDPVEKTFKVSKDAKFIIKAKNEDEKDKELKADELKEAIEKMAKKGKGKGKGRGGFAKIETTGEGDDETVTKITFGGRGRGKKKKDE
jgi:hypothetical protein